MIENIYCLMTNKKAGTYFMKKLSFEETKAPPDIFSELSLSNKKRISEKLFIKLRNAILSNRLPSGYVFPSETELCKKLEIGRSTLREAYASLEMMNLITRTKHGTYVNDEADIKNSMNMDVIAQMTAPDTIMEFRHILEVGIVNIAAEKATTHDVESLTTIVELMAQSSDDPEALTIFDYEFHSQLARIADNELLVIALNSVRVSYEKFVLEVFKKNMFEQSLEDHRAIIEALRINDSKEARRVMRNHLKHVEKAANMP